MLSGDDDEDLKEIRKLQLERSQKEGNLISFSSVSFDTDLYGGTSKPKRGPISDDSYVDSIAVNTDDIEREEEIEGDEIMKGRKSFLRSFTGPKQFVEELQQPDEDFDPFKDFKKKTVADKEDEYKRRWRNRKLSPPRLDPFKATKKEKAEQQQSTTYKDVMLDTQLEKERKEVLIKIAKKQREEKEEKEKADKKRKKELKKEQKRKHSRSRSRSASPKNGRSRSASPKRKKEGKWHFDVKKNGAKIENVDIDPDFTLTFGRGDAADVRLDHESISKQHAKVTFMNNVPHIMDLNSTNGTAVNKDTLTPGQWYKLNDGDKVKFGCSTRDYYVVCT